ncbi:hypothetical protein NECID01_1459 [Nematocida sp. AWRm77]|nr:hypothetical protein NECID01_1459 [Nematocida sp. AWRm77]
MQRSPSDIDIINIMLGEEGVIKYNAVKNRFLVSESDKVFQNQNFLHMYRENNVVVPNNTISSYKTNLQRLRRKIEECKVRITEVTTPNNPTVTTEVQKVETVKTEEVIVVVSPNGTKTPLAQAQAVSPPVSQIPIAQANSLEQFKASTVFGTAVVFSNGQPREGSIKLEGTTLSGYAPGKKGASEELSRVDLSTSKLFLVLRKKRKVFFCFNHPARYVPVEKETDIINLVKAKTHEILLKNTNTGSFTKETTLQLEFSVQDMYSHMHAYKIEDPNEFIRWLLVMKMRMHPVALWNRADLIESIQK